MRLSVVIPYFRAIGTIGAQLEALCQQSVPDAWEVIIADNESSDELTRVIRPYEARLPNLRVTDASDRRGEGRARNAGVEAAKGDSIVFCDADDEVGDGWLAAMSRALAAYQFVACRLDFKKLNPEWAQRVFRDHRQQNSLNRLHFPPYVPHAGGGTLGFRRSVFDSVDGFDESWPVLADKEFCIRAQLAGTELHFVPDAVVHYRCRANVIGLFKQARLFSKYGVLLYQRYHTAGWRPERPWKHYIDGWNHLLLHSRELRHLETRANWVYQLGWRVGQLEGSVRFSGPPI